MLDPSCLDLPGFAPVARGEIDSRFTQHFDLVFKNLDINAPRLTLDKNAVNTRTLWAERSEDFRDPCAVVAGETDPHESADLQRFN